MRTRTVILAAALSILGGCACDTVPSDAVERCEASAVLPASVATDILFVIDDSGSMSEEQANLSANLGAFVDALVASPVQNDFRIGVTTTAVETFSGGQSYGSGPASGAPFPDGAIVAIRQDAAGLGIPGSLVYDPALYPATAGWGGNRILDRGSPTLAQDFKANVLVGLVGSGKEQPFRAARLALSDRLLDANAGFLRPGARLAVIFVTDEDDCSDTVDPFATTNAQCHDDAGVKNAVPPILDPVPEFGTFLLGPIGGETRDVVVGAIAGFDPATLVPSCSNSAICSNTACGTAYDGGDRFAELLFAIGGSRMRVASICDASFRDALLQFAEILVPAYLPLDGTPADWRMLSVTLTKSGGAVVPCTVAAEGTPAQAGADAVYGAPRLGRPAQLTFQNACRLDLGDRIDVKVICAG